MKISIAMATYNGAAHLREQLASFAAQTHLPDELVVTDDRSTDDTLDILRDFAETAPFDVRIEANPQNLGFAQNFNRALSLCTGDLVFLSDQDDVWKETKIAYMATLAAKTPGALCLMNDALMADGNLVPSGQSKLAEIRASGLPDSAFVMGCCAVLRRELLEFSLPIPALMRAHDNWLVGICDQVGRVTRVNEPLQYYRLHGGNTSDFFINRPRQLGWGERQLDRVQRALARITSTSGFEGEYRFYASFAERLKHHPDFCETTVAQKVAARLAVLTARWNIRTRPRLARMMPVLRLWRRAGYESKFGVLKDILLSSAPPRPDRQTDKDAE